MAEPLASDPMTEESDGDGMKKDMLLKNNAIFPNGYRFNPLKSNTGEMSGCSNNVQRRQFGSVDSSLYSDSDNENDSDSSGGNLTNDGTGFGDKLNEINDKFSLVSITSDHARSTSSNSKMEDGFIKALKKAVLQRRPRRSSFCSSSSSDDDFSEDEDINEENCNVISRGPETKKITNVRITIAPFNSAFSLHRRNRDENNLCKIPSNASYFDENFEQQLRSREHEKLLTEIVDELPDGQVNTFYDFNAYEWNQLETASSNVMMELEGLNSSFDYDSASDYASLSPSTVNGDDCLTMLTDNLSNQYSSTLSTSPESGILSDGDHSPRYRTARLSLDSFTSEDNNISHSRKSLSPYHSYAESSNGSTSDIRSVSPYNNVSPSNSISYDSLMPTSDDNNVTHSRKTLSPYHSYTDSSNGSTSDVRSVSPYNSVSPSNSISYGSLMPTSDDNILYSRKSLSPYQSYTESSNGSTSDMRSVSPYNSVLPSNSISYDSSTLSFSGIDVNGGMEFSPQKMNIGVNSNVTSNSHKEESKLSTTKKLMAGGGITFINPAGYDNIQISVPFSENATVSPALKSSETLSKSVSKDKTNDKNPMLNTLSHSFSNLPTISTPVTIDKKEVVNVAAASNKRSPPVNMSQKTCKSQRAPKLSASESMKGKDSFKDVLRFVKSNEILYRIQYCLMLVKIRRLEKKSEEEAEKVLYNYLFELSSVFGYDEMNNMSAKDAEELKSIWEFQLVALIQCILQYLKKPEIFTKAQSNCGGFLFTPLQVAAIFNFKEPLVARCIADCIVHFTEESPDEKMEFSLVGEGRGSLMCMLQQIGESHAGVLAQLKKVKRNDKTTTINDPFNSVVQTQNSIGRADLLRLAMHDANIL